MGSWRLFAFESRASVAACSSRTENVGWDFWKWTPGPQWQEFLLRYRCLTLLAPGSSDRGLGYEKVSLIDLIVWVVSHVLQKFHSHGTGTVFCFFFPGDRGSGVLAEAVNSQAPLSRSCWSGQQKSWRCPDCDLEGDLWLGWLRTEKTTVDLSHLYKPPKG